ncbi:MAG: YidC/Oxa1 family membrane protein insertase [Patescibacteria group bacterium]
MLSTLFNEILYRPIFNVLVFLYNIIPGHDFGIAIILLTILIRIILFPIAYKSIKSRQALSVIQPKIKEVQQKYKTKEEQSRELMKIYREHKVNPFSGCLPILIQLPVLIALYQVLIKVLQPGSLSVLYSFVKNPGTINSFFLGFIDLSAVNLIIVILAGISQFFSSKLAMKQSPATPQLSDKGKAADIQKRMGQQMLYLGPILTIVIGLKLPAGLSLYWLLSNLLGIGQDYYLLNKFHGKDKKNS